MSRNHQEKIAIAVMAAGLLRTLGVVAEPRATQDSRPVVVVFLIAASEPQARSEERFQTELGLALDSFEVVRLDLRNERFPQETMPVRLGRIEELAKKNDAFATVWIEPALNGKVLLNVVALSTGRALLRIVEAKRGPSAEAELAFAAQELLGEAYLFSPETDNPQLQTIVNGVRQSVASAATPAQQEQDRRRVFGLIPQLVVSGGIGTEEKGASARIGGGLMAQLSIHRELYGRLGLNVLGGPKRQLSDGVVSGVCVAPELLFGYAFDVGPFRLGPILSGALEWSRVDMAIGEGPNQSFHWISFRLGTGLDLKIPINQRLSVVLDGSIGLASERRSFRRLSDGSVILDSGLVQVWANLGLLMTL